MVELKRSFPGKASGFTLLDIHVHCGLCLGLEITLPFAIYSQSADIGSHGAFYRHLQSVSDPAFFDWPSFGDRLSVQDIDAIKKYILDSAQRLRASQ